MPSYRLLHSNCRTGQKTKKLTDVEYLVWQGYMLSADDFGVCDADYTKLQGDDPRLRKKPARQVATAIETLISVGLTQVFDDGSERYLCQSDWQKWQRIKYPSDTTLPPVPAPLLARFEEKTVSLFVEHHPQRLIAYPDPILLLTTANANANASSSSTDGERDPGEVGSRHPIKSLLTEHELAFVARYQRKPAKYGAKDAKHAKDLIEAHGFAAALDLLRAFFATRDPFVAQSGHGLGVLANGTVQNKLIAEMSGRKPMGDGLDGVREFVRG